MKLLTKFVPAIFSAVAAQNGSDLQAEIIEAFERDIQKGLNTVERKTPECDTTLLPHVDSGLF